MNVFEGADLFVELVRRDYADEVALIVYYGSYATGSASARSDLDFYFIPDDGKAGSLYHSVLLNGLAFEFWGMPRAFAQKIAAGEHRWSVAPSIIANARVLYARSGADRARFEALQAQISALQQPESRPEMVRRALGAFERALFYLYRQPAATCPARAGQQCKRSICCWTRWRWSTRPSSPKTGRPTSINSARSQCNRTTCANGFARCSPRTT